MNGPPTGSNRSSSRERQLVQLAAMLRRLGGKLQREEVERARQYHLSPLAWRVLERLTELRQEESFDGLILHLRADVGSVSTALWLLERAELITRSKCRSCTRHLFEANEIAYSLIVLEQARGALVEATASFDGLSVETLTSALARIEQNWPAREF